MKYDRQEPPVRLVRSVIVRGNRHCFKNMPFNSPKWKLSCLKMMVNYVEAVDSI